MIFAVINIPGVRELILFGGDDFQIVGFGNSDRRGARADYPVYLFCAVGGRETVVLIKDIVGFHSRGRNRDNRHAVYCLYGKFKFALTEISAVERVPFEILSRIRFDLPL